MRCDRRTFGIREIISHYPMIILTYQCDNKIRDDVVTSLVTSFENETVKKLLLTTNLRHASILVKWLIQNKLHISTK